MIIGDSLHPEPLSLGAVAQVDTVLLVKRTKKTNAQGINFPFLKNGQTRTLSAVQVAHSKDDGGDAAGLGEGELCNFPSDVKHCESVADALLSIWRRNEKSNDMFTTNQGAIR
jgi:hypothetical protein